MPIFYYDDIDLATNQLQDVALEIISDVDNEPAANNFAGRIAFDQATDTFSFYNGTAWVDLTGTGGVVSVDAQNGVKVDTTTGDVTVSPRYTTVSTNANLIAQATDGGSALATGDRFLAYQPTQTPVVTHRPISDIIDLITNTGGVEDIDVESAEVSTVVASPLDLEEDPAENFIITPQIYGGTDYVGYVPSSGTLGAGFYLEGDGTWTDPGDDKGVWTMSDGTTTQTVPDGTTIDFSGGVGISTEASDFGVFYKLTFTLDLTDSSLQVSDGGTASDDSLAYSEYDGSNNQLAEIVDAPLNVLGTATADVSMTTSGTEYKITGLTTTDPSAGSDIVDKKFVDDSAGEVFNFQGGYSVSSNSPNLVNPSPNNITKGESWVVTGTEATFYGEMLRAGDFLIANDDAPTTLAQWEVVQNNIGLAENDAFGLAYYDGSSGMSMAQDGEPELDAVANDVGSYGANNKSLQIQTDEFGRVTDIADAAIVLPASAADLAADTGQVSDFSTEVQADINAYSFAGDYGGTTMTVDHDLGTTDVRVQAYRNSGFYDTINFHVNRYDADTVVLTTNTNLGDTDSVRVLVQAVTAEV